MTRLTSRALAAETLGTFALVFFGAGVSVVQTQTGAPGHLGVAVVNGLTVAVVIGVLAPISGAHINPAATLALVLARRFALAHALPYVLAQLTGAALAAMTLLALFGREGRLGATVPSTSTSPAFVLELMLTFFLLLAALRSGLPWVVGGFVTLAITMGGPITGASMNPARSFGPALVGGVWDAHWLYWLAPLAGAALAALAHHLLFGTPDQRAMPDPDPDRAREFQPTDA